MDPVMEVINFIVHHPLGYPTLILCMLPLAWFIDHFMGDNDD